LNRKEDTVGALEGKKVAIVVANGFEQVELTEPRKALEKPERRPTSSRRRRDGCADGGTRNGGMSSPWTSP